MKCHTLAASIAVVVAVTLALGGSVSAAEETPLQGTLEGTADASGFPPPESLYDHIYVMGDQVKGWYSVDERSAGVHRGEHERQLAEAERGPTDHYHEAVEAARKEDLSE